MLPNFVNLILWCIRNCQWVIQPPLWCILIHSGMDSSSLHPLDRIRQEGIVVSACVVCISNGLYSATSLASLPTVTHWQLSPIRLHLDMEKIAHISSDSTTPTGDWTRVARLAIQCSTDWAIPYSNNNLFVKRVLH